MVTWKTCYLDIINLSLFLSCTFKSLWLFMSPLLENLLFCGNNGPLPNVILASYILNILLNWRLKFMEMTECLKNWRFYRTVISNYPSEAKFMKIKEKNIEIRRCTCSWFPLSTCSWFPLRTLHLLRLRLLHGHTIAYKNIDVIQKWKDCYKALKCDAYDVFKIPLMYLRGFCIYKDSLRTFW